MRVVHPLWRGFFLAAFLAAMRFLLGPLNELRPYQLDRAMGVFALALLLGAFLHTLPGRFRHGWRVGVPGWRRALLLLFCGAAMALALRTAGGTWLTSLMEGSVGAYGFALAAWVVGFITVRIMERGRRA